MARSTFSSESMISSNWLTRVTKLNPSHLIGLYFISIMDWSPFCAGFIVGPTAALIEEIPKHGIFMRPIHLNQLSLHNTQLELRVGLQKEGEEARKIYCNAIFFVIREKALDFKVQIVLPRAGHFSWEFRGHYISLAMGISEAIFQALVFAFYTDIALNRKQCGLQYACTWEDFI